MDRTEIVKEAKEALELSEIHRERKKILITPDEGTRENLWKTRDKKVNIMMVLSILPNSFVLSYFYALRTILLEILEFKTGIEIEISILFMQDIAKTGAHKKDFIAHYESVYPDCDNEEVRTNLVELKQSEFASLFNMLLFSFFSKDAITEPAIKRAIRKIKTDFYDLSVYRKKTKRNKYPNEVETLVSLVSEDIEKTIEELKKCRDDEFKKWVEKLPNIQKKILFEGGDRAVILEIGRVLYHSTDNGENIVLIAAETLKNAIEFIYPNEIWKKIKDSIIWFTEPIFREGKMPIYLTPLSQYVNEENKITSRELEEFYHGHILLDLKSGLFRFGLEDVPNKLKLDNYNGELTDIFDAINSIISRYRDGQTLSLSEEGTLKTQIDIYDTFNIPYLRKYEMETINKGFLTIQEQILQQLALML